MNDIEKRARLNRILKLRIFRPMLPPFPPGTIPEREKNNADLWEEAQGYVPHINIQHKHTTAGRSTVVRVDVFPG